MKTCKVCGFDNPDVNVDCMKCEMGLDLSIEQVQNLRDISEKMTDTSLHESDEEMRMSWQNAMAHRFDWLWEIGDKIQRITFKIQSILLIMLILGTLVFLAWIFSSFG